MRKKILLFFIVSFLIIVFTPLGGKIYEYIIGRKISSGFWGPAHPEYIEGFFMSYMFFITLFTAIFGQKEKYKTGLTLIGFLLLIDVFLAAWENLIINLIVGLIGWSLGKGILLAKQAGGQKAKNQ